MMIHSFMLKCGSYWKICIGLVCCMVLPAAQAIQKPECSEDKIRYTYTECENGTGRWRVAVPKTTMCDITKSKPPIFAATCDLTCSRGQYLNTSTGTCEQCPPGTYSLGGGLRFDRWNEVPSGFSTVSSFYSFTDFGYLPKVQNCSSSVWKPQKDFISSNGDDCSSSLTYTVDVKTKGSLTFVYQSTDEDLIFHFFVRNSECSMLHSSGRNKFLRTTGASWSKYKVPLVSGRNILTWKTTGLLLGSKNRVRPAMIRSVEITGISYTTSCYNCSPGYFSDGKGSDWCRPCPANMYSDGGNSQCRQCDSKVFYSFPASSACIRKPPCTANDIFETLSPCKEGVTTVKYGWKAPKVCNENLRQSVALPKSGTKRQCPPCNAGFTLGSSGCQPCPDGTFSDGADVNCKNCTIGSRPSYAFDYHWWDRLPSNMAVSCLTVHSETCFGTQAWIANGGMIISSHNEIPLAYLLLKLEIPGFRSPRLRANGEHEYGKLIFVFELKCSGDCVLYLMKNAIRGGTSVLGSWHGKTAHSRIEYPFSRNETMNITWAFQKTSENSDDMDKYMTDAAVIYSVEAHNVLGAPAVDCRKCAGGSEHAQCIACAAGHFIEDHTHECKMCPPNTILPHETYESENCSKCSHGIQSNDDRTACSNNCTFRSSTSNKSYDFIELLGNQAARSPPSFSGGHKYVHHYNFSICGNGGYGSAECSYSESLTKDRMHSPQKVRGMICRSTEFSAVGDFKKDISMYSQPRIIASVLNGVYENEFNSSIIQEGRCGYELFPPPSTNHPDVVYALSHPISSKECPSGTTASVRLRCNPDIPLKDSSIKMPDHYPEGSCDGCNFYFMWESEGACPLCKDSDYYFLKSDCEDGYVDVKYLWKSYPKTCKGGQLPTGARSKCTSYKVYVVLGLFISVVILIIFMGISFTLWRRNQSIQYKYQKLVMDSGKNSAAASSCAISSSESENSDDEKVLFKKKRAKILKGKGDKGISLNETYHSIQM